MVCQVKTCGSLCGVELLGCEEESSAFSSFRALSPVVLFINDMFYASFPVALPQTAVSYLSFCVWVQVGESAPALCDLNAVVLQQPPNKLVQCLASRPCGVNRLPQLLLLGVENGFLRGFALLYEQGIFFVQLYLSIALGVVLPVGDSFCRSGEQVNLVESPPLTQLHNLFPEIPHELPGAAVFCACPAVTGAIHVVPPGHIRHPHGMDDYVTMEIPGFLVPVCVRTDKSDMTGKVLLTELLSYALYLFQRQAVILPVPWVKGENVVVGFHVPRLLVLTVFQICLDALQGKAVRGTEDAGDQIFLPGDIVSLHIQKGTLGLLIVLKAEVEGSGGVVGIFTGNVLDDCHSSC